MQCFDRQYNEIPKAELHCHLEGAIRTSTIIEIAREYGLKLPSYEVRELDRYVKVCDQFSNLQSVLDAFQIAQNSITSTAVVERIAWELFEDAARQNIRLFEMRFSPDWAFAGHSLDWDEALEAILRAVGRAENQFGMVIGLIAITSRSLGPRSCEKTVDWAVRWKEVIQGIDLADAEFGHPIGEFTGPVARAQAAGLKVTVHTGEDASHGAAAAAANVIDTILTVHPDRIGHGIHAVADPRAVDLLVEHGVTLEVNPWSNYLTNSVRRVEDHPLKRLFDLGVKVTINSDDPELLDTNLNNEYRIAHEVLGMSMADIAACNWYAVQASFLPDSKKQAVMPDFLEDM